LTTSAAKKRKIPTGKDPAIRMADTEENAAFRRSEKATKATTRDDPKIMVC
jgi:hypothetical protein